ncbi:MAG: arginase family protein, partial [Spirochaeta sp.]|nr:arginase family protein [Spirochaeta sp.]
PPAVAAFRDVLGPDEAIGLIQIDAHADLRESYEESRDSHACIARRIHEDLGMPVIQIGVRALSPEEVIYRAGHTVGAAVPIYPHDAADIVPTGLNEIPIPASFPSRAYMTIDVDGLDPSIMPATGTPVPGGLGWYQTLSIIESIARSVSIIGFDVVELAPIAGQNAWQYTAAELTYRVMGIISRGGAATEGRRRAPPDRT